MGRFWLSTRKVEEPTPEFIERVVDAALMALERAVQPSETPPPPESAERVVEGASHGGSAGAARDGESIWSPDDTMPSGVPAASIHEPRVQPAHGAPRPSKPAAPVKAPSDPYLGHPERRAPAAGRR